MGLSEQHRGLKFNKATLFSWLIFLVRGTLSGNRGISSNDLGKFLESFEAMRESAADTKRSTYLVANCLPVSRLVSIYETRSSARVADVSSVILRDAVIWLAYQELSQESFAGLERLRGAFTSTEPPTEDDAFARRLLDNGWGQLR